MTSAEIETEVLVDEPLEGIASWAGTLEPSVSDEDAASMLEAEWTRQARAVPAQRGVSDVLARIMSRLRGREELDDLGEVQSAFDLIALHVPPGGQAALTLEAERSSERSIKLEVLGLGYGDGRRVSVALKDDIAERGTCMRIVQHVVLRVRRFTPGAGSSEPLVSTDVLGCGQRSLVAWPDCPYCGEGGEEPDPFRFEADAAGTVDLREFDAELRQEQHYELAGERQADVAVAVPVPGGASVTSGFHFKQQINLACTVSYRFPPARSYTPYRWRSDAGSLPCWRAA